MRRSSGFTYIEITIVVVILMALMAIAFPRLKGGYAQAQLKTAARDVTALTRFARNVAVLTENQCELRLAPDEDSYQLVIYDKEGERVEVKGRRRSRAWDDPGNPLTIGADLLNRQQLPRHVHFAVIYTAAELTPDTQLPRVIFYPDGTATPATIAMQNDQMNTLRVEIYRTTGMTRVETGLPPEAPQAQKLYYGPGA